MKSVFIVTEHTIKFYWLILRQHVGGINGKETLPQLYTVTIAEIWQGVGGFVVISALMNSQLDDSLSPPQNIVITII